MLTGAILGAIGGIIGIIIVIISKQQKTGRLMKSIAGLPAEYAGLFNYASPNRYQKSLKIYDSIGLLYLIGNTVYYKTSTAGDPVSFNLSECRIQMEPDWRRLKWFSITTPRGEKYYFDSYTMGAFSNDSSETTKAFNLFQSKVSASSTGRGRSATFEYLIYIVKECT